MYIHVWHESYRKWFKKRVETNFKQMGMRSHDIPVICYALDAPPSPRPTVPTRERRDQGGLLIGSHLRGTASTDIHRDVSPSAQAEWRIDWYPRWPGITWHPKNSPKLVPGWFHHFFSSCEHWTQNTFSVHCLTCKNLKKCCGLTKVTIHDVGVAEQWIPELIGWPLLHEACQMELWSLRPRASSDRSAFLVHRWPESPSGHAGWNMKVVHGVASVLLNLVYFLYHFCRLRMPWDDTAIPVPDLHLIVKPMIFSHVISRCQTMMAKGEALTEYSPKRTVMDWKGWHRLVEISDIWTPTHECWTSGSPVFLQIKTKWIKFE